MTCDVEEARKCVTAVMDELERRQIGETPALICARDALQFVRMAKELVNRAAGTDTGFTVTVRTTTMDAYLRGAERSLERLLGNTTSKEG